MDLDFLFLGKKLGIFRKKIQKSMVIDGRKVNLTYKLPSGEVCALNSDLIRKQKLTPERIHELIVLHKQKAKAIERMTLIDPGDGEVLQLHAKQVTRLEYALQKAWGFKKNKNWHRFWELPGCKCPQMDNRDSIGTGFAIISGDCLIHGNKIK